MSGELKAVEDIVDKRKRSNRVEYLIEWSDGTESWEQRTTLIADGGDAAKAYIRQYEKRAKEGSTGSASTTPKRSASRGRATTGKKQAKSPARKAKSPARSAKTPAASSRKSQATSKKADASAKSKRSSSRARSTKKPVKKPEPESEEEEEEEEEDMSEDEETTQDFEPAPKSNDSVDGSEDGKDDSAAAASASDDFATSSGPRLMAPMWVLAAWTGSVVLSAYCIESSLPAYVSFLSPLVSALPFLLAIAYVWELPAQGRLLDPSQAQATAASLLSQAACFAIGCGKGLLQDVLRVASAVFRMLAAAGRPGDSHGASAAPLPVSLVSTAAAVATAVVATSISNTYTKGGSARDIVWCKESCGFQELGYYEPFDMPIWSSTRDWVAANVHAYAALPFVAVDTAAKLAWSTSQNIAYSTLPYGLQPVNLRQGLASLPFVADASVLTTLLEVVSLCALATAWARVGARPAGSLGSFEQWALLISVLVLGVDGVQPAATKALECILGKAIVLAKGKDVAAMAVQAIAGMGVAIGAGSS